MNFSVQTLFNLSIHLMLEITEILIKPLAKIKINWYFLDKFCLIISCMRTTQTLLVSFNHTLLHFKEIKIKMKGRDKKKNRERDWEHSMITHAWLIFEWWIWLFPQQYKPWLLFKLMSIIHWLFLFIIQWRMKKFVFVHPLSCSFIYIECVIKSAILTHKYSIIYSSCLRLINCLLYFQIKINQKYNFYNISYFYKIIFFILVWFFT